jgi:phospho-N-acetylmuramoyl-pentapeptide-transferase
MTVAVPLAQGFAIALLFGWLVMTVMRRLQFGQPAYEDAPSSHRRKSGTPTMGGIVFVLALLPALAGPSIPLAGWMLFLVAACGAVGLIDDLLTVTSAKHRGLRARTKFLATALVAVIFLREISNSYAFFPRDVLFHTETFALTAPHWLWLVLGMLAITGTIHAVNLSDGLDGLAAGSIIPPLWVVAGIALAAVIPAAANAAIAGIGACCAFLFFYNLHPAKLFMGDTGSLALGALLSGTAILTGEMLLLVIVGGVFVIEALSVIVQVLYFKATRGKRILRMSPLHHHFELAGWPETAVTARFWGASLLCSIAGWLIVR